MHKALIGLILAATAMTPATAQAQESGARSERQQTLERFRQVARERAERREARSERRETRSEERQEQQTQRQERRQERQAQRQDRRREQRQERTENRGARTPTESGYRRGWNGSDDPRLREHQQRYDRVGRRNAVRHGQRDQARDAIADAETRRERRDLIRERRETVRDRRGDRRDRWQGRDGRNDRWSDRNDRGDRWRDRDGRNDRWSDRGDRRHRWDRQWRNDRRYDWSRYRYSNRHLYRMPRYYSPFRNHSYSRFSIGFRLGSPFYNQRYWLNDPWQYRLPAAPYGTQWVRYYNDVMLVDTWSGEVLDVIYDFFW